MANVQKMLAPGLSIRNNTGKGDLSLLVILIVKTSNMKHHMKKKKVK